MHDTDFPRIKKSDLVDEFPGVFDAARYVDVGVGWLGLVQDFVREALPHDPSLVVHEIKEKWGSMRIWCDTDVVAARLAKGKAEIKSGMTCEVCGDEGYVRRPPPGRYAWWRCRCYTHSSLDQKSWPRRDVGALSGQMQCDGQWYQYDRATDSMIEIETPERFR